MTSRPYPVGHFFILIFLASFPYNAASQQAGKITDVQGASASNGTAGANSNSRVAGLPGAAAALTSPANLSGMTLPLSPAPAVRDGAGNPASALLPEPKYVPLLAAPADPAALPQPAAPALIIGAPNTQQTLQTVRRNAADIKSDLAEPAGGDPAAEHAADIGSQVFDRGGKRQHATGAEAVVGQNPPPASGLSSHASRPYQQAILRLGVPLSLVTRLDKFVEAHNTSGRGLSHAIRTADVVTGMINAPQQSFSGYAKMHILLAVLLRRTNPDIKNTLETLQKDPAAVSLFNAFERDRSIRVAFNPQLLLSIIAYSDDGADPHTARTAKSLADKAFSEPSPKLWAQRWGRWLAFADAISMFATGQDAAAAAARGLSGQGRPGVAATDAQAFREASRHLRALMAKPQFALLPLDMQADAQEVLRFFLTKADPEATQPRINENARGLAPPGTLKPVEKQDSAVEIEINSYPEILDLLTTPDGTLAQLLGGLPLPEDFPKLPLRGGHGAEQMPLRWDWLQHDDKLDLLQYVSKHRTLDFFQDRKLHGMTVKRRVILKFAKETRFLGKTYQPGRHLVDVSRVLRPAVEYRGPDDIKSFSGLELHFRDDQSAGEVSNDAWKFLAALGVPRTHQHIHIVAPLPVRALVADPELQSAVMGDFYRRVNLMAEMIHIVDEGGDIGFNKARDWENLGLGFINYFGPLQAENLKNVTSYLQHVGQGSNPPIGDDYKLAWVGFRGSDKYDRPGLYGLEYRAIGKDADETVFKELLNSIQGAMLSNDFGIPREKMRRWLERQQLPAPEAVAGVWYSQPWPDIFRHAAAPIKKELGFFPKIWMILSFRAHNIEYKMLVHDWSNDPLVFEDEALKESIIREQKRALGRLHRGEETNTVMGDFLLDSGLYAAVAQSLGLSLAKN